MPARPRKVLTAVAASGGLVAALMFATPASAVVRSDSAHRVPVGTGIDASKLHGAVVFGTTPDSTPERVSFVLRANNLSELEARVTNGSTERLSVGAFAARYGRSPAEIGALQTYLAGYGIRTTALANRLDVTATGTAGEFDAALATEQSQVHVPAVKAAHGLMGVRAQTVHNPRTAPKLPASIASSVLAVLGLSNYAGNVTHVITKLAVPRTSSGPSTDCVALTGIPDACHTPQDFASRYGVSSLYYGGATGAGRTIGIVTLAALDPGAPQYYWDSVVHLRHLTRSVTTVDVDGGSGAPSDASGTIETDLDVEQSGGVAPGANVRVYQAPNSDNGFADAFFTAASEDVADTVSASWGESEAVIAALTASGQISPAYADAYNEAFLELEVQGQSTFAAAGDAAAYDDSDEFGSTELAVDNPGDSPYLTATGGTTLPTKFTISNKAGTITAPVSVTAERAWGWDYLWNPVATVSAAPLAGVAESLVVGTGGGFSSFFATPSYQRGVSGTSKYKAVKYLTPTTPADIGGITEPTAWSFNPTPSVSSGTRSGRALPDFSADADPETGYLIYEPSAPAGSGGPLIGGGGGTSFTAPQFAGATAVMASALGHRVGFLNPIAYRLAKGGSSPFTPLNKAGTSNDNIYYTGNPGTVFNPATGLGLPNFGKMVADVRAGR